MITENFFEEALELNGISIRITTYKIGNEFHCHISNADPGATIARASSGTKESAQEVAMNKAWERLTTKTR